MKLQPNGKELELFKVYFKPEYICLYTSCISQTIATRNWILVSFFLSLSTPFSFLCSLYLNWLTVIFFPLNSLDSDIEPVLSHNKSSVLHVLHRNRPEKQCIDLFQLRKQANISLAIRRNQMYNLCSRVNHVFLQKICSAKWCWPVTLKTYLSLPIFQLPVLQPAL